ncbi:MAG: DsbA family protein, partial [Candidatus Aminicenantes bacterium]|nr:DsbA family protein [Candidatus Aminicenantes bacterium]
IEHFKQYNNYKHRYNLANAIENFDQIVKKYNIQNISKETFMAKMNSPEIEAAIKFQVKIAGSLEVNGTPTVFLSNRKLLGAVPKEILEILIKKELERIPN